MNFLKPNKNSKVYKHHKHRTGKIYDYDADKKRTSLPAGKRISKNGNKYYESRRNRSDIKGLGI